MSPHAVSPPASGSGSVETNRSYYCDYLLTSQPLELDNGHYQARVVITALGVGKTRSQRFLDLETYVSKSAALDRGRKAGMDWIDVNDRSRG